MTGHKLFSFGFLALTALILASCGSKDGDEKRCPVGESCAQEFPTATVTPTTTVVTSVPALSCNLAVDKLTSGAGESRTLTISGSGGRLPYTLAGIGTFTNNTSTVVTATYNNSSLASITKLLTAVVRDADGRSASCTATITILGYGVSPTGFSCKMLTSTPNPRISQSIEYVAEVTGGNGSFTWGSFSDGAKVVSTTQILPSKISATTSYSVAGSYKARVSVSSGSETVACEQAVTVRSPALYLYGTAQAPMSSTIRITALTTGYDNAYLPNFAAVSNDPGISATLVGIAGTGGAYIDVKRVNSSDNSEHNPVITVTATAANGDTTTANASLKFTSTSINCDLNVSNAYVPNGSLRVSVTSTSASDVYISEMPTATPDGSWDGWWGQVNSLNVRFPSVGNKLIRVKAYSPSKQAYCNNGAYLEKAITVASALSSCTVTSNPAYATIGQHVTVAGALAANSGAGPFSIRVDVTDLTSNPAAAGTPNSSIISGPNGLSQVMRFNYAGLFQIKMTIQDGTGSAIACTTQQQVVGNPGIFVEAFELRTNDSSFRLSPTWNSEYPGANHLGKFSSFSVSTINVPNTYWTTPFPGVGQRDWFALVYHGSINITEAGCYQFRVGADDGAIFLLDGAVLNPHGGQGTTNFAGLQAYNNGYDTKCYSASELGLHRFQLKYYQGPRTYYGINLSWRKPSDQNCGIGYHTIPAEYFFKVD